jgi:serine-type D-Ala-D-Ala carboxypeptidase/endopeptidase (penicillin-binding protein 4)
VSAEAAAGAVRALRPGRAAAADRGRPRRSRGERVRMRPRRLVLVLALLAATLVPAWAGVAPAHAGIGSRIAQILRADGFGGAGSAVSVWTGGRAAYQLHQTTLLVPASNMKLVTSATALYRWGPEHRFKTELYLPAQYAAQPYEIGVVVGDVSLKGYGDPSLSTASFQKNVLGLRTSTLGSFVTYLKALGVTKIRGRIVGDATWFDARRTVWTWKPGLEKYCGPLSALSVNEGLYRGARVSDAPRYAARRLREALEAAGIDVTGGAAAGSVPRGDYLAATVWSAPLSSLLKTLNKASDNFFAEMLLKGLGRDFRGAGTTAAGLRVARATLWSLGVPDASFRLYDGSGLDYHDRLSAAAISRLLRVMARRADFATFYDSLAIAGRDGTLRKRMRGTAAEGNFHGKTGTLAIASNLSGYVTSTAGHGVVVSILMNAGWVDTWRARRAQDRIVVALAKSAL